MQSRQRLFALISVFALLGGSAFAQEGANKSRSTTLSAAGGSPEAGRGPAAGREIQLTDLLAQARPQRRAGFSLMPSFSLTPLAGGPNLPVLGGGTLGRLTKWTGLTSSNSFVGDSTIFESKEGLVGIGTDSPTSKLTVQGMIETTLGGYKFPDGTIQTTAGISFVTHDASLMGLGTAASPLGIAPGGVNTIHLANGAVTATKIANGTVVRSFNGLFDNISLLAGSNITITPAGNTLTISAPNVLSSVAHDSTLTGNGTAASPLGVADGGIGTTQIADYAVTLNKIAINQVVTSLNNLREAVTLEAGPNITIAPSGNTLTIASTASTAGTVKAMIRVSLFGDIEACNNLMTGTTTGNCGFVITEPLGDRAGVFRINFGFPITNRFVSVTCEYDANGNCGANYRYFDGTSIEVFTFAADDGDDTRPSSFTLILY